MPESGIRDKRIFFTKSIAQRTEAGESTSIGSISSRKSRSARTNVGCRCSSSRCNRERVGANRTVLVRSLNRKDWSSQPGTQASGPDVNRSKATRRPTRGATITVDKRTISQVKKLNSPEQHDEVSKMLGGDNITAAVRRTAREMMQRVREVR